MLRPRAALLALIPAAALTACEPLTMCTTSVEHSLIVEVRDAVTGAAAATGAVGFVQDGAFREELKGDGTPVADPLRMYGPFERPGIYTVGVEKLGYRPWRQEGVRVRDGDCHVRTVTLRADLQPEP